MRLEASRDTIRITRVQGDFIHMPGRSKKEGIRVARSLYFALILLSLIWGGSFFFIKILLPDFGPWTVAFLRSTFGLATITGVMLVLRKPFGFRAIPWVAMIIMALVNTAIPWALIGFSETRLTSSLASVLNATTPLWTLVVGVVFFRVATTRMQWAGMGIAFLGLLVLVGVSPTALASVDLLGFSCMLAATLCYAVGTHLSKRLSGGLSMYQVTFGTLISAMAGSGLMALTLERDSLAPLASLPTLGAVIGLGVFGSGVAYILFYFMVQKEPRNSPLPSRISFRPVRLFGVHVAERTGKLAFAGRTGVYPRRGVPREPERLAQRQTGSQAAGELGWFWFWRWRRIGSGSPPGQAVSLASDPQGVRLRQAKPFVQVDPGFSTSMVPLVGSWIISIVAGPIST